MIKTNADRFDYIGRLMCGIGGCPKNPPCPQILDGDETYCDHCTTVHLILAMAKAGKAVESSAESALAELTRYFTSGNDIPVARATIPAKDFWAIVRAAKELGGTGGA